MKNRGNCRTIFFFLILPIFVTFLISHQSVLRVHFRPQTAPRQHYVPLEGQFAKNNNLSRACTPFLLNNRSPETAICYKTDIYAFTDNMITITEQNTNISKEFISSGGRPLSGQFDHEGNLYITDALLGLLKYTPKTKTLSILATKTSDGRAINFADDLAIGPVSGNIYFTDATYIHPTKPFFRIGTVKPAMNEEIDLLSASGLDLLANTKSGRVLMYDVDLGEVEVVWPGLGFPNGIAVAEDESFLIVSETNARRLIRIWLKGARAGFVENFGPVLPGMVDGISIVHREGADSVWAAVPALMIQEFVYIVNSPTWFRRLLALIPTRWFPVKKYGLIVEFDMEGKVIGSYHDDTGVAAFITSVRQCRDVLLLGSLKQDYVLRCDLSVLKGM